MKNTVAFAFLVWLVCGCIATHQLKQGTESVRFSHQDPVHIASPIDGAYGNDLYYGSGQNTARIMHASFMRHAQLVKLALNTQDSDEAQKAAIAYGARYLIYPTLLHWEERATEWSGIPDAIEIKIDIYDVAKKSLVQSATINGKSGWATMGGDHPQDLLPIPVEDFVAALYGEPPIYPESPNKVTRPSGRP